MSAETFLNGKVMLYAGDSRDVLKTLADNSIDSIVCDPPYALVSIVKRFGKEGSAACKVPEGGSGAYARASAGFMGKTWDTGETAFAVDFWTECLRVLKPGGHVVAFSGTRTYHRMTCAIEDAGFEVRDMLSWLYGSGFPKSHDVSKGIDKAAGAEREVVGLKDNKGRAPGSIACKGLNTDSASDPITAPATDAARQWEGWGTALKPACEPICFGRKPLIGTVAENVLEHGTGAINVDGCRVGDSGGTATVAGGKHNKTVHAFGDGRGVQGGYIAELDKGRWPANIIHDGSDEVLAAFPDAPGQQFYVGPEHGDRPSRGIYGDFGARPPNEPRGDSGSAARFFYQAAKDDRCELCSANIAATRSPTKNIPTASSVTCDALASQLHASEGNDKRSNDSADSVPSPSKPCLPPKASIAASGAQTQRLQKTVQNVSSAAKLCDSCATVIAQEIVAASRSEPLGLSVSRCSIEGFKKTILLRCLASYVESRENTDTILTTTNLRELFGCVFHAIGESIRLARVGNEASTEPAPKRLWYSSKADADDRLGSKHPTVKPVDLMQWLCRLVTPRGGTVLDPFAGTGTTGEAAFREGFNAVLIEREPEYQADIRRRMALCLAGPEERKRESIKAKVGDVPFEPGSLFAGIEAAE